MAKSSHNLELASVLVIDDELLNLEVMSGMLEARAI